MSQNENEMYKRIRLLGEGSYGKAYLCDCTRENKLVVIKQMNMTFMSDQEKKDSLKEAKILASMKHDNIINFKEVYKTKKNKLCIVMDYADGGDLSQKIKSTKQNFSEDQILDWITQMCSAIQHVHSQKTIHRDIKSQNIFLTKENQIKLGDFGIARVLQTTQQNAQTIIGTPYYLSPEIIENQPYSTKTDIWSLGVVLYELCALKVPFESPSLTGLALKIIRGQYQDIPCFYSKELKQLIKKMLIIDPNQRPSCDEILEMPIILKRNKNRLEELQKQSDQLFMSASLGPQVFAQKEMESQKDRFFSPQNPPKKEKEPIKVKVQQEKPVKNNVQKKMKKNPLEIQQKNKKIEQNEKVSKNEVMEKNLQKINPLSPRNNVVRPNVKKNPSFLDEEIISQNNQKNKFNLINYSPREVKNQLLKDNNSSEQTQPSSSETSSLAKNKFGRLFSPKEIPEKPASPNARITSANRRIIQSPPNQKFFSPKNKIPSLQENLEENAIDAIEKIKKERKHIKNNSEYFFVLEKNEKNYKDNKFVNKFKKAIEIEQKNEILKCPSEEQMNENLLEISKNPNFLAQPKVERLQTEANQRKSSKAESEFLRKLYLKDEKDSKVERKIIVKNIFDQLEKKKKIPKNSGDNGMMRTDSEEDIFHIIQEMKDPQLMGENSKSKKSNLFEKLIYVDNDSEIATQELKSQNL